MQSKNTFYYLSLLLILIICLLNINKNFFIGDDAYISFRYSLNLINGNGIVYNPGERVEGYTNFLWVILVAIGMYFGFSAEVVSSVLSIASAFLFLYFIYKFLAKEQSKVFTFSLLLILALSRTFTGWSSSGLETMFFTTLIFIANYYLLKNKLLLSSLFFSLSVLTRPEGALFSGLAGVFLLFLYLRKEISFKTCFSWALPIFVTVISHLAFRLIYYGYPLPNTFYAKVSGAWFDQGWKYLSLFNDYYQIIWYLPFLLIAFVRPNKIIAYFTLILSFYFAYILYVGGDRFEFRFLLVIFPYFFYLLLKGVQNLSSLVTVNKYQSYLFIALLIPLFYFIHSGSNLSLGKAKRHRVTEIEGTERYAKKRASQGKFIRSMIDAGKLGDNFTIAVGGAGALPYFTKLPTVDRRGLNDAFIAHQKVSERTVIAHEHDAPYEYLEQRKVAAFDIFNRFIFDKLDPLYKKNIKHDGKPVKLRAVQLDNRYMIFATFLDDQELEKVLRPATVIYP